MQAGNSTQGALDEGTSSWKAWMGSGKGEGGSGVGKAVSFEHLYTFLQNMLRRQGYDCSRLGPSLRVVVATSNLETGGKNLLDQ